MTNVFEFTLNGDPIRLENCSPNLTLLEWLRARRLTGAKEGCAEGDCGACSIAMAERDYLGRITWRAVNSCLLPMALVAGREIITVEGVGRGERHPIQQALVAAHGSQCGYCTPGIVMSLFEGYHRPEPLGPGALDDQLCGNLCRCTGYRPIVAAARAALQAKKDCGLPAADSGLAQGPGPDDAVKVDGADGNDGRFWSAMEYTAAGERFFRPTSLPDVFKLLRRHPEARLIAGATELGLDLTKRYKKFPTLISLEGLAELQEIRSTEEAWWIGAAATLTRVEEAIGDELPAFKSMLRHFGSRQIRNRATLGGNLVTASPVGDAAPVLLALDARLAVAGRGRAEIPLAGFFQDYRQTALRERELVTAVIVPRSVPSAGTRRFTAFYKVSRRREMDIATVSACFVMEIDAAGHIAQVRLAYGGVAPTPLRARKAERALRGRPWNERTRWQALAAVRAEFTPISDVRGSAAYRSHLTATLLEKFFAEEMSADPERKEESGAMEPEPPPSGPAAEPHESAHLHVTGEAMFVDDQTAGRQMLEVWPVCAPHARARILRRDASEARRLPGIRAVLLAEDIPGLNDVGVVKRDEVLLADREVFFHGQIIALVVGESQEACRRAAERVVVDYEPMPGRFTIEQAIAADQFHNEPNAIRRGDAMQAWESAPQRLEGTFAFGGQDHFYLETQAAWAQPGEDGAMYVSSSTQHPSEVQGVVAHVLNVAANKIVVEVPRMGGGFGGKETQAATPAALAALAAWKTGAAVRVRYNRDQDMILTGKRHPFLATFKVGFDAQGLLLAVQVTLYSNGGWSMDLSQAVTDRALFHLDNAYYLPHVEFRGRVAKTNLVSNTAFRGFGGPQGMLVIEEIMDRVARRLGFPPETVREHNLYDEAGGKNTTPYGQVIEDNRLQTLWHELKETSRFDERRREITAWNQEHPQRKRGLAITPVKFGISFTVTHLNQAGALVLIYADGSVQVNHGGTEMGQGIHTNILAIAARELGVTAASVRVMTTHTGKVPNTSATAASAGTDLNGAAVKNACEILRERLRPIAAQLLAARLGTNPDGLRVQFAEGEARAVEGGTVGIPFAEVVQKACLERVGLSATGFYRTPGISWDRAQGRGKPFHYFANGVAVTEVEVDGFTGRLEVLRTDILQDAGDSINAGINRGQIEGGFVQGLGWLTCEELKWDGEGRLLTHAPDTYKIPAIGDRPRDFRVHFLARATQPEVIHGSKAVGEPPLMLALSAREAIRDAVAAFGTGPSEVALPSPATAEAIFMAIQERRAPTSSPAAG